MGTFQVGKKDPVYVLDSPGILSPAYSLDQQEGRNLAICGCVKDTAVKNEIVHGFLLEELRNRGKNVSHLTIDALIQQSGGALDRESAAVQVLKEFRAGQMGQFTLDII